MPNAYLVEGEKTVEVQMNDLIHVNEIDMSDELYLKEGLLYIGKVKELPVLKVTTAFDTFDINPVIIDKCINKDGSEYDINQGIDGSTPPDEYMQIIAINVYNWLKIVLNR